MQKWLRILIAFLFLFSVLGFADDEPGKQVPTDKWKVVFVTSQETAGEDGKAENVFDEDTATIWHTQWQDEQPAHPHGFVIDLGKMYIITGFTYQARIGNVNGVIREYQFFVGSKPKKFGKPVSEGEFEYEGDDEAGRNKLVTFKPVKGRFIKLKSISAINEGPFASCAEFIVYYK
ncbi:discoidin domain-containing protein [Spirochaetota bacterium]